VPAEAGIANPVVFRPVRLEKQSQFSPALIDVRSYLKGNYGKKASLKGEKKQSQFKANIEFDECSSSIV
jgi:hypothetical protein